MHLEIQLQQLNNLCLLLFYFSFCFRPGFFLYVLVLIFGRLPGFEPEYDCSQVSDYYFPFPIKL